MKLKFLLFLALTASLHSVAQTWVMDSVFMSAGYRDDIYYSLKNDSVKADSNKNWHIALEMLPQGQNGNVSVRANHTNKVKVYSLPFAASAQFGTLSGADTTTKSEQFYNADTSWHVGAFNKNAGSSPFDYGWGMYDMSSHHVNGDSLYLVYLNDTVPYKFTVTHYHSHPVDSIYWDFRIAKFDGTEDTTIRIFRKDDGYVGKNFAYYDAANRRFINREPASNTWDIVFTRYIEYISMGPGPKVPYPVTGILSNPGLEVAEADGVNPDTAKHTSYTYSKYANIIGSDWKAFNNTSMLYEIDTDKTYFVKSINSDGYYQIKFTGFSGSQGKTVFGKRKVANLTTDTTTTVGAVKNMVLAHAIVPNPANASADMMIDVRQAAAGAQLIVTDITGKMVQQVRIDLKKGLNVLKLNTQNFTAGNYVVTVTNGNWKFTEKLVVQH